MIQLPVYNQSGKQVSTLAVDETQLGSEVRPALLKQAYVMFHANQRQGSARTKNRGRVEGSTRKLYKQKHTGNARMGAARTNLRKGGGRAFAKVRTREDFRQDMPKRMRRLANRNALLAKLVDSEVKCFDNLALKAPSTKEFHGILQAVGVDRTCLVALDGGNENARLSARNLPNVDIIRIDQLNVFELLNHRYLVLDEACMKAYLDGTAAAAADEVPTPPDKPSASAAGKPRRARKEPA